jgi:hypothetical protein
MVVRVQSSYHQLLMRRHRTLAGAASANNAAETKCRKSDLKDAKTVVTGRLNPPATDRAVAGSMTCSTLPLTPRFS